MYRKGDPPGVEILVQISGLPNLMCVLMQVVYIPKSQHPHPKMKVIVKSSVRLLSVLSFCNSIKQLYMLNNNNNKKTLMNEDLKFHR